MIVTELYASPLIGLTDVCVAVRVAKVILLGRPCLYCTSIDSASRLANLADFESRLAPSLDQNSERRECTYSRCLYRKSLLFETLYDDDMLTL